MTEHSLACVTRIACLGLAVALAGAPVARADDEQVAAAREVFEKHQKAVVWVSAVMKMRAGGGGLAEMFGRQEQKVEAVGTVIHESGLTVLSYTMLDPSAMMNAAMANVGGGGENKIEFKTELSGVKIRLADGTEIPGKLVLRDDDLDLAFVMPTEQGKKLPYVPLEGGEAPPVKPLDPIVVIWRLGQSLDRQSAVAIGRVSAVVTKPRTFYLCSGVESLGTPAFVGGKALGIVVMRKGGLEAAMSGMVSIGTSGGVSPVVVPAADVMEVAQQALAKKDEQPPVEPATADQTKLEKPRPPGPGDAAKVPPGGRRGQ